MGTQEYPGRTLQKKYPFNFAPRLGVAYQVVPRTVLRASYGITYLTLTGDRFLNSAVDNVGFGDFARVSQDGTPDGGLTYPVTFSNPLPDGMGYVPFTRNIADLNRSTLGNWFVLPATDQFPGYEHVVQFNIQRELGSRARSWVLELAYNGNFGRKLPFFGNLHSVPDAYNTLGVPLGTALNRQITNPFLARYPPTQHKEAAPTSLAELCRCIRYGVRSGRSTTRLAIRTSTLLTRRSNAGLPTGLASSRTTRSGKRFKPGVGSERRVSITWDPSATAMARRKQICR